MQRGRGEAASQSIFEDFSPKVNLESTASECALRDARGSPERRMSL
jgi:hypothetical protein